MMKEIKKKTGCWPGVLIQRDFKIMIKLRFWKEIEKCYGQEVQSLCKISLFKLATENKSCPREIDQRPLENIIQEAQKKAFLLSTMIMTMGSSSQWTLTSIPNTVITKLVSMKIVIILVIFCCSAHQTNCNYIPLLLAFHIYSVRAWVDTITLLNHLDLLVSYNVLQKKLKEIMGSTIS